MKLFKRIWNRLTDDKIIDIMIPILTIILFGVVIQEIVWEICG